MAASTVQKQWPACANDGSRPAAGPGLTGIPIQGPTAASSVVVGSSFKRSENQNARAM